MQPYHLTLAPTPISSATRVAQRAWLPSCTRFSMISLRQMLIVVSLLCSGGMVERTIATEVILPALGGPEAITLSLQHEAHAALDRAYAWLLAQQHPKGHWSNPNFPALSGLAVWALVRGGEENQEAIERGVDFILSCAHDNGAIFVEPTAQRRGGGLSNYNTAISMVALNEVGRADLIPYVLRAREFIAASQLLSPDSLYHGGMGYDAATDRAYTDLSNSYIAFEAMRLTEQAEDFRTSGERADLDWAAALQFVQRVHNHPEYNDRPWVSDAERDVGGFVYHPEQTRAGTFTDADGIVRFRSMPGMTYAGMLSYIYAGVDRHDPRVQATVDWAVRHWNLEANNPVTDGDTHHDTTDEREGLFYFYNVLSKGMAAFGQDEFHPTDRPAFNWRTELAEKLIALQRIAPATGHGYWVNEVGRYWESDPVLVTAYAVLALQMALGDQR